MNDQMLMDNYLLVLKSTVEVYVHGTLESSNESVRKLLKQGLDNTMCAQANTYTEMTKYGWYKIDNVKDTAIKKVLDKVKQSS
ncbi:MAG: spore coat protein [Bacilli bacterium]|nr:spore coat protein [Bacilli bacterium]